MLSSRASLKMTGIKIGLDKQPPIWKTTSRMPKLSTNQVAKKLGLGIATLTRHIQAGKVPAPPETMAGGMRMRLWSDAEIERLRMELPKIANGRKTRYQKLREKQGTQPRAAAIHKEKRTRKKK
jgi:predicted DNA-binding transcriptional regulator AlpA